VPADIFGDLVAEQDRLEAILSGLASDDWHTASGAVGWTVADVVLHLAQTEEAVVASVAGKVDGGVDWGAEAETLDDAVNRMVSAERSAPHEVFRRPQDAPSVGRDPAQAQDASHDSTCRTLVARSRHRRPAGHSVPRHRPVTAHRVAGAHLSALCVHRRRGRAPRGVLRADRTGRHNTAVRPGCRRLHHHRLTRCVLPGRSAPAPAGEIRTRRARSAWAGRAARTPQLRSLTAPRKSSARPNRGRRAHPAGRSLRTAQGLRIA
jgi:hypothetical protein